MIDDPLYPLALISIAAFSAQAVAERLQILSVMQILHLHNPSDAPQHRSTRR